MSPDEDEDDEGLTWDDYVQYIENLISGDITSADGEPGDMPQVIAPGAVMSFEKDGVVYTDTVQNLTRAPTDTAGRSAVT